MSSGDFHTHSSRSDGTLTPGALVDLAVARGVRVMALTDHDTMSGIEEAKTAAARHSGFLLVPGVELSCDVPGTEVHMLGLMVDSNNEELRTKLELFRKGRVERGQKIVMALTELGVPIDWNRVLEIAGDASVGRPHIAQALIERGHVKSIGEAFELYLARNGPAYAERERLTPAEAIVMIREAGGLPIMAHPSFTESYQSVARDLSEQGLFGMEVYYQDYPPELVESLNVLAQQLGLFALGGSDYHGLDREGERRPGDIPLPDVVVASFLEMARGLGCRVPDPTP